MGKTAKKRAPEGGVVDAGVAEAALAKAAPRGKKAATKKAGSKKGVAKKVGAKKSGVKKVGVWKTALAKAARLLVPLPPAPPLSVGASPAVLDRLWAVVSDRRDADPTVSHSARLLRRGTAKVAQKFGEEAVECVIEAMGGNRTALIGESADVLYHLVVMWVNAGVRTDEVWAELARREGVSGVAEKASRAKELPAEMGLGTTKIP